MSKNFSSYDDLSSLFTKISNKLKEKQNSLTAGNGIEITMGTSSDRIQTEVPLSVVDGKICVTYTE